MKIDKSKIIKLIYEILIVGAIVAVLSALIADLLLDSPKIRFKKYENNLEIKPEEFQKDTIKVSIEHPLLERFLKNKIYINDYPFDLRKFIDSKGTEGNQYNYYFPIDIFVKKYPEIFVQNKKLTVKVNSKSPLGKKSYEYFNVSWDSTMIIPPISLKPMPDTLYVGDIKPNHTYKKHFFRIDCENEKLYITLLKKTVQNGNDRLKYYIFSESADSILRLGKYESENIICNKDIFVVKNGFKLKETINQVLDSLIEAEDD